MNAKAPEPLDEAFCRVCGPTRLVGLYGHLSCCKCLQHLEDCCSGSSYCSGDTPATDTAEPGITTDGTTEQS